jgi:hypothetical protein
MVLVAFLSTSDNMTSYPPIYRRALGNVLWVPLLDAFTFTALGIYRIAKHPKKNSTPYLFR